MGEEATVEASAAAVAELASDLANSGLELTPEKIVKTKSSKLTRTRLIELTKIVSQTFQAKGSGDRLTKAELGAELSNTFSEGENGVGLAQLEAANKVYVCEDIVF